MHFWGWIWPATLLGWYFVKQLILRFLFFLKCLFYNQLFPEMAVQDDQSITKSTHILLIRCPKIYFVILPLVLRCFKQFAKLFQPFTTGFKQLPNLFQHFAIGFQQLFNIFQHGFSSVFHSILLLLALTFVSFSSRFFGTISKGVLYSKMNFWGWIWPATLLSKDFVATIFFQF